MAISVADLTKKFLSPNMARIALIQVRGLAADFWKDGPENPLVRRESANVKKTKNKSSQLKPTSSTASRPQSNNNKMWSAAPAEISERMWGDGFVTPGGAYISDLMTKPLGLTKDMSVLDLSAGLGGRIRRIANEYGCYVTGYEPDPEVAKRGMEISQRLGQAKHAGIEAYDPEKIEIRRMYDCVIARETFYRIQDKPTAMKLIAASLKARGHLVFTDYLVNPEDDEKPAIIAWKASEILARPLGLQNMVAAWQKVGIKMRVQEDMSDFYKKEVAKGLQRLAIFLGSGVSPDPATKLALERRIRLWAHRVSAMEQGMKFYRFYGNKL
jgi:SAM-dependent methyltransferase